MTGPGRRSRYSPANGLRRCPLCREIMGPDHVRHPWQQIAGWLWSSHPAWKAAIVVSGLVVMCLLAEVIASVRNTVTGS